MSLIFKRKLIAALTNRDMTLREIRDCILVKDEDRCKKMGKEYHQHWRDYHIEGRIMCVDENVAIPAVFRDGCVDVFHAFHRGPLGLKSASERTL